MTLGKRICDLRTAKNLSQGDLAEALDVSRQSVSKWETDTSVPDLDKLVKLCNLFEVSMDELVRGEAPKAAEPSERIRVPDKELSVLTPKRSGAQVVVGIILICLAGLTILPALSLLSTDFNGVALPLWFAILTGGIVCLAVRGSVVLWTIWCAVFAYCIVQAAWNIFVLAAMLRDTPMLWSAMTVNFISIAAKFLMLALTLILVVKRRKKDEAAL